jgi:hypothetical protein
VNEVVKDVVKEESVEKPIHQKVSPFKMTPKDFAILKAEEDQLSKKRAQVANADFEARNKVWYDSEGKKEWSPSEKKKADKPDLYDFNYKTGRHNLKPTIKKEASPPPSPVVPSPVPKPTQAAPVHKPATAAPIPKPVHRNATSFKLTSEKLEDLKEKHYEISREKADKANADFEARTKVWYETSSSSQKKWSPSEQIKADQPDLYFFNYKTGRHNKIR